MMAFADIRYALRQLRRSPGFALAVIATLGIGIGLNTAVFAVVDCVLLRPLGYRDAARIAALQTRFTEEHRSIPRLGGYDYADAAQQLQGIESAAYYNSGLDGIAVQGEAVYLPIALVSPRFSEVMGVTPLAGRLFNGDDHDGSDALINASFARDRFGSAQAALGKVVRSNGKLYTIAGVLPDGFSFPGKTAVWLEGPAVPHWPSRSSYSQQVVVKRRSGVSQQQLDAELTAFSRRLGQSIPEDRDKSIEAVPLQDELVGGIRATLRLLMGSAGIILLVVCANITHLQLVRATREQRAVTIRTALGASRTRLAAHALLEALLLAVAGCMAALALAVPAMRLLIHAAPPDLPRLNDIHLNADLLLFSLLASVLLLCITSAFPLWRSSRIAPASALKQDTARGTQDRATTRLRDGLLAAEIAMTLTLSVAAILLTRQLIAQSRADLGFAADQLITLDTHAVVSTPAYMENSADAAARDRQNLTRLQAVQNLLSSVPGVRSVDAVAGAPMGFDRVDVRYAVRGRQVFAPGSADVEHLPDASVSPVTPGLLRTLRVPLLQGRGLLDSDRADAPPVLLISRTLAQQAFPAQNPIGQQIMCGYDETSFWWTIVGVVGDIRADSPASPTMPAMYVPVVQHPRDAADMQFIIRTQADPAPLMETLRRRLTAAHPEMAVKAATMRDDILGTERTDRFRTLLFASFAAISIALAAVGIYGITAYSVAQRRFEFALRIVLGASRPGILRLVLGSALAPALLGIAVGAALSFALARVLGSIVGGLPGFDAAAYLLGSLLVLALTLLAALLPARNATVVDPMQALRAE